LPRCLVCAAVPTDSLRGCSLARALLSDGISRTREFGSADGEHRVVRPDAAELVRFPERSAPPLVVVRRVVARHCRGGWHDGSGPAAEG
jgi:hypothetical protein